MYHNLLTTPIRRSLRLRRLREAVDPDELDEVFAKYHDVVNMSASELEAWANNPCSREASLSREPIKRNLKLLKKSKDEWTQADVDDANQTIGFVSRMQGNEQGEDVSIEVDGRERNCGSKRDISLKNWARDMGKD